MLNNGNKTNCGFSDEIVSYIYDEIGSTNRTKFENHLADCTVCTDEFAAISNARFSVFEWRREEFAHLSTPEIVIPYAARKNGIEEKAWAGFWSGLRGMLSLVNVPVAVAAVLAVSLGLGFLAMTYVGRSDQQIVANVNVPPVESHNTPVLLPNEPETGVTAVSANNPKDKEIKAVKAVDNRRPRLERQLANNPVDRDSTPQLRKAPVLSSYDDNDDRSLRLSDLFDEIGG